MKQPAISVILPIYNVAKYLRKSLGCLMTQTFRDFDVILVDDESSDESGNICDEHAARDLRFRVIHQKNKGPGGARNAGIDSARGKYILFLDPDDWYETDMLERLWDTAMAHRSDIVVGAFMIEDVLFDGKSISLNRLDSQDVSPRLFSIGEALRFLEECSAFDVVWGRLYKRELFGKGKQKIRFDEGLRKGEDCLFNLNVFPKAKTVSWLPKPLYHYVFDSRMSLTRSYQPIDDLLKHEDRLLALRKKAYESAGIEREVAEALYREKYLHARLTNFYNMYQKNTPLTHRERRQKIESLFMTDDYLLGLKQLNNRQKLWLKLLKNKNSRLLDTIYSTLFFSGLHQKARFIWRCGLAAKKWLKRDAFK
ncbi:MAG: glycosyltransferase [Myxococcales bacterium]|jgi:glycosyltransferase involved in cell wall biosynthesis|nr:glycosyltransferase [Myxococcales bacterium]